MAITLQQPSGEYQSAFNRINYNIKSDNATEVGFKFVIKIYKYITNELITTIYLDAPANPNEFIEFDVSNFVNSRFEYTKGLPYNSYGLGVNDGITYPFYLKCYEYYKVGNDYVIDLSTEVVSNYKVAIATSFNTLNLDEWYGSQLYYVGDSCDEGRKPLTDWTTQQMYYSEIRTLSVVNDWGNISEWVVDLSYKNNNGTFEEVTLTYPPAYYGSFSINNFYVYPDQWILPNKTLLSVNISATWNSCDQSEYFTWLLQSYTFKGCSQYPPVYIAYLNKYGVFDYFSFDLVARNSYGIERKGYARQYTGGIYNDRYQTKIINPVYNTDLKEKWKLTSGYLTTEQSRLLQQLYTSPLVYMKSTSGRWVAVNLVANTYEIKEVVIDKMFNLELEIELPYLNKRQTT